ncbi:MAG: hypothetical protein KDE32_12235 [Novosphingobium sp.]|nr:hypothetical protein [Novosphingobium sp.]
MSEQDVPNSEPAQRAAISVDPLTVCGLALLLMPLLTMWHEQVGHAGTCLATGGQLVATSAFYVDCHSLGAAASRLVSVAGPLADLLGALVAYGIWKRVRGDLARLVWWYVWIDLAFTASGYLLFSGVLGLGDLAPGEEGGLGQLPYPEAIRIGSSLTGGFAYFLIVKLGIATLSQMIGKGPETRKARRTIAHLFYGMVAVAALIASLPNPAGLFITLASAGAANIGGRAGFVSIGYATRPGEARGFVVTRSWPIFALGALATAIFAVVLGPTIKFTK